MIAARAVVIPNLSKLFFDQRIGASAACTSANTTPATISAVAGSAKRFICEQLPILRHAMTAATHPLADRRDHCQRLVAMYFVSSVGDYAQFSIRCEMREGALRCLPPRFKRDIGSPPIEDRAPTQ